jgi:hypothetical protein
MHTYIAITSDQPLLPPRLALLTAPVFFAPSPPEAGGELAGHLRGVIVDPRGHVVLFILRPLLDDFPAGEQILIPLAGLELGGGVAPEKIGSRDPIVRLLWSREQLLGQPRFTGAAIQPKDDLATPVPPSPGGSGEKALREALYSGAVSGAAGAAIGLALGGVAAVPLGVFFAIGGGIVGAISGASTEPAADAAHLMNAVPAADAGNWQVRELETAIHERALYEQGVLRAMPIAVAEPKASPPQAGRRAESAHPRG